MGKTVRVLLSDKDKRQVAKKRVSRSIIHTRGRTRIENGVHGRKKWVDYRNRKTEANYGCKKCGGMAVVFKQVWKYPNGQKETFHYKISCHECGEYFVKRTKDVYDVVKNLAWVDYAVKKKRGMV